MTRRRRPRWRAYLLLARVSNLPTVWTNVLAGLLASGTAFEWPLFARLAASISLFYSGGMVLNDAFDAPFDRNVRAERPIPSGDLTRAEAFVAGGVLMLAGQFLLAANRQALFLGAALIGAIVLYDAWHKRNPAAPLVMGACRALVYCVAAAAAGTLTNTALVGAVIMGAYIVGLTVVARLSGAKAGRRVPLLLAGISLVDATFIAVVSGSIPATMLALGAFPLTLFLQRFVPGD